MTEMATVIQNPLSSSSTTSTKSSQPALATLLPKLEPRRRKPPPANPLPTPPTPSLPEPPSDTESIRYQVPSRRILSQHDLDLFHSSPTAKLVQAWIFSLSESVEDTTISMVTGQKHSESIYTILSLLDEIDYLITQYPPDEQGGSRFGNKRFRDLLDKIKERTTPWHTQLGIHNDAAVAELSTYLNQSFGNRLRIDYGSGHELNFTMWLLCLYQLRILAKPDFQALVLCVFQKYLQVMRTIQSTYYLEPAGSHGVWGLDDYQFLPFLFGASQLLHHKYITPRSIHQQLILEEGGADYLYLNQIVFVNSTKTVQGLRWHSPMLDDISSAKSWEKVQDGMRRMFVAEILQKLPVMQHFLFGSLIPAVEAMSTHQEAGVADETDESEGGQVEVFTEGGVRHVHQPVGWGDCCGIKVPSGVAAGIEARKKGEVFRRIPFD